MESLWPEEIANIEQIKSPVSILKEQASSLGKITKNILVGELTQVPVNSPYSSYRFNILAPSLRNYRYSLFEVTYNILEIYPVTIKLDQEIFNELYPNYSRQIDPAISNESELIDMLKKIFHSDKVKQILKSLMSESGAMGSNSR